MDISSLLSLGKKEEKDNGLLGSLLGTLVSAISDKRAKENIEKFDPNSKKLYSKKKKRILNKEEE